MTLFFYFFGEVIIKNYILLAVLILNISIASAEDGNSQQGFLSTTLQQSKALLVSDPKKAITYITQKIEDEKIKKHPRTQVALAISLCESYVKLSDDFNAEQVVNKYKSSAKNDLLSYAKLQNCLGASYVVAGKLDKAASIFSRSIEVGELENNIELKTLGLIRRGQVYSKRFQYKRALEDFHLAYELLEKQSSPELVQVVTNDIAIIYSYIGDYEKSEKYYLKVLAGYDTEPDDLSESIVYYNLGNLNIKAKKYERAINHYQESLSLADRTGDTIGVAYAYIGLAKSFIELGDNEKALGYSKLSLKKLNGQGSKELLGIVDFNIAKSLLGLGQNQQALAAINTCLESFNVINDNGYLSEAYKVKAEILNTLNQNKGAYDALLLHVEYERMVVEQKYAKDVAAMQMSFNSQVQEKQNAALKHENQLAELAIADHNEDKKFLLAIIVLFVFFLLSLTFIWIYRRRFKRLKNKTYNNES